MPQTINCPPQVYEIMLDCWNEIPERRPTFPTLYKMLDAIIQEFNTSNDDSIFNVIVAKSVDTEYSELDDKENPYSTAPAE